MKLQTCILALFVSPLFASETVFPITNVQLRCMMQEKGIAANIAINSAELEGESELLVGVGVDRLNTWTPFDEDGIRGIAKVIKQEKEFWFIWRMYNQGKTFSGKQPLEFSGDTAMFADRYKFPFQKLKENTKQVNKGALVSTYSQSLELNVGLQDNAISMQATADLYFKNNNLSIETKTSQERLRFNYAVLGDQVTKGYIDIALKPQLVATFENVSVKELLKDSDGSIVELNFDCKIMAEVAIKRTDKGKSEMKSSDIQQLIPWVSEDALKELMSDKLRGDQVYQIAELKDQKKLVRLKAQEVAE